MHETINVSTRISAYIILADVEFLQEGQAAQHKEHAAEPQQQARLPRDRIPPILSYIVFYSLYYAAFYTVGEM